MQASVVRPSRLLPLRVLAVLMLLALAFGAWQTIATRHEMLALHPALSQKLLATMVALILVGALALAFLAFWRQRFGLWIVLATGAAELAIETWAGFEPLYLLRIPAGAALLFLAARHAWPELRGLTDVR